MGACHNMWSCKRFKETGDCGDCPYQISDQPDKNKARLVELEAENKRLRAALNEIDAMGYWEVTGDDAIAMAEKAREALGSEK